MITSEKQYNFSKKQFSMLLESLASGSVNPDAPAALVEGTKNGIKSLIKDLESEIKEYENLRKNGTKALKVESWNDILLLPIRFRIASNLTIEEFAHKVGIHSRQIASYEKDEYRNTTTATLYKILEAIALDPSEFFRGAA